MNLKIKMIMEIITVFATVMISTVLFSEDIACLYINVTGNERPEIITSLDNLNNIKIIHGNSVDRYLNRTDRSPSGIMNSGFLKNLCKEFKAEYAIAVFEYGFGGWVEIDLQLIEGNTGFIVQSAKISGPVSERNEGQNFRITRLELDRTSAVMKLAKRIRKKVQNKPLKCAVVPFYDGKNSENIGYACMNMITMSIIDRTGASVVPCGDLFPNAKQIPQFNLEKSKKLSLESNLDYVCYGKALPNDNTSVFPLMLEIYFWDTKKGKLTGKLKKQIAMVYDLRKTIKSMDLFQEYFGQDALWTFYSNSTVNKDIISGAVKAGIPKPEKKDEETEDGEEMLIDYQVRQRDVVFFSTDPPDQKVLCIDAESGKCIWSHKLEKPVGPGLLFANSVLFWTYDSGKILAIDAENGSLAWSIESDGTVISQCVSGNFLVFANDKNELVGVNVESEKETWKQKLNSGIVSIVAGEDRTIVSSKDSQVIAYESSSGGNLWKTAVNFPESMLTITGNEVYVITDKKIYCLDAKTGKEIWTTDVSTANPVSAGVYKNNIVIVCKDGNMISVSTKTKKQTWNYKMNKGTNSQPVVSGDKIFVSCLDGYVYELSVEDGKIIAKYNAYAENKTSPVIVELEKQKLLIVANAEGAVYCFPIKP